MTSPRATRTAWSVVSIGTTEIPTAGPEETGPPRGTRRAGSVVSMGTTKIPRAGRKEPGPPWVTRWGKLSVPVPRRADQPDRDPAPDRAEIGECHGFEAVARTAVAGHGQG